MCRPVRGSHAEVCPGGHIGPPLRGGEAFRSNENQSETMPFPAGRDGARPYRGAEQNGCGGVWSPRPTGATQVVPSNGPMCGHRPLRPAGDGTPGSSCPTGGCGEPPRLPWPAAHSGASAPAGARKWVGIAAEIIPKVSSNLGQSLSHGEAVTAPFTQGSLWGRGDTDCRVASLLAMTVLILCHSEEAQRADVGIRPFYDGRGFGPPYLGHGLRRPNFLPKFGASVRSSAPTESPINHPSQPARSEASAPAAARDGRKSPQRPSQKGDRPRDCRGSA